LHKHREQRVPVAAFTAVALVCAGLAGCNHVDAASGPLGFTAWSVPDGGLQTRIQVRLAPRVSIPAAVLEASSPRSDIRFEPARFMLNNLAPPEMPRDKDHNPPALGKTILRTFLATARRPGDYPVRIRLRWNGQVETRRLTLHFAGGRRS